MEHTFTGALEDPRPLGQQMRNWTHEEMFGQGGYAWKEIPETSWKTYRARSQNGSGKCGPFSICFALGRNNEIENGEYVELDTDYVYNLRRNAGPGMWLDDLFKIACDYGAPLDPNHASEENTDEQGSHRTFTEDQKKEALKFRSRAFLYINPQNLNGIAQAIDMGYTPIYLMRCNIREWTAEPFVDPAITPDQYDINHFVPQYLATLYKGQKTTLTQDSWGSSYGKNGLRKLKEDFIQKRVFACGYVIDLKNEEIEKPFHTFSKIVKFGESGDEVKAVQRVLQYEKYLATHTLKGDLLPLGYFGAMTAEALRKWQIAHGMNDYALELDIRNIRFGPKSIAEANKIYGKK